MWRWWALALAVAAAEAGTGHYTPTWAVHVPGGAEEADQVALDHGFINLGQIFTEHYHFEHAAVRRRSARAARPQHARLRRDARVRWARQQRLLRRSKRDLLRADDPHLNDQRWSLMWYLNRGPGLDMNVIPAWREGVTGRGVVVTILDDGLETDHPDLVANYDPLASYDVNNHDSDPQPRYDMIDSNRHGTRCAGEVAAAHNNSLCAVGVAYGASVGGVRMLDGDVTDAVEARSLSLNPQHVDVYSASWGPDDDGKTVDGPGELATRAFIEGVNKGRGGKGSIFVWASGNGGREHDNCNCDGYTNSIWTLSISSATERGDVPWYSEMCSSTLAATYSSGAVNEKQVVTTDLHHSCTSGHTGTSASAPLAAGICALALEANRDLTWRDMQHIVVRTARPERVGARASAAGAWRVNGVGRNVSHAFGYGLLDAAAMVRAARAWRTVPPQRRCEVSAPHADKLIPAKSQVVLTLEVRQCAGVNFLEHVQAKISLSTARRGDLQIHLTSPLGTRVTLLATRSRDISRAGFNSWPFMSVHTWGESPIGNWQLEIHNEGRYMGELSQWELVFYGTELPPQPDDEHPSPSVHNDLNEGKPIRIDEMEQENSIDELKGTGLWRESQKVRDDGLKDIPEAHIVSAAGMTSAGCLTYSSNQPHQCIGLCVLIIIIIYILNNYLMGWDANSLASPHSCQRLVSGVCPGSDPVIHVVECNIKKGKNDSVVHRFCNDTNVLYETMKRELNYSDGVFIVEELREKCVNTHNLVYYYIFVINLSNKTAFLAFYCDCMLRDGFIVSSDQVLQISLVKLLKEIKFNDTYNRVVNFVDNSGWNVANMLTKQLARSRELTATDNNTNYASIVSTIARPQHKLK